MRPTKTERRVLHAITLARMMVPSYGRGEGVPSGTEIDQMLAFSRIRIHRTALQSPAILTPPFNGWRRLLMALWLPRAAAKYIELHECGHGLAGDADEPTFLQFTGPLPEAEEVADLFALSGMLSRDDLSQDAAWVERRIREMVPLEDRGWQVYRVPELAPKALRVRSLIDELLD